MARLKSNGSHLYMNFSFCTVVKDKPFSRADKIDQTACFIIIRHPAPEPILRVSSSAIKLENQNYLGNVSVPHVTINSFYVILVHNNGQQMLMSSYIFLTTLTSFQFFYLWWENMNICKSVSWCYLWLVTGEGSRKLAWH